jgi:hypothetical protein
MRATGLKALPGSSDFPEAVFDGAPGALDSKFCGGSAGAIESVFVNQAQAAS